MALKKVKNKIFKRHLPLGVQEAYRVVASRTYLCTEEEMLSSGEVSSSEIFHTDYMVDEAGITHAVVHMRNVETQASGKNGQQVANPEVETGQAVAVQPIEDNAFAMHSLVSLPNQIGNMRTILTFEASEKENDSVEVTAYIEVDIPVKAIGKSLTKKLLDASPASVDRGLERIVRLSGREGL